MAHVCPNCSSPEPCHHACPVCSVGELQALCHQPPDPLFICEACQSTFNADLSLCEDGK